MINEAERFSASQSSASDEPQGAHHPFTLSICRWIGTASCRVRISFSASKERIAPLTQKTRKRILRPALLDVKFKLFMEGITTDGDARPPSSSLARETRPVLLHRISQYDRLRDILHWLAPLLALAL
jgi:hypothetical protein